MPTRCFSKNKSKARRFAGKIDRTALKIQYGKYYKDGGYRGALDDLYTKWYVKKLKKGIYTYKITINGKNAGFRKDYRNTESDRKLVAELLSFTKGQSQFEKAWTTMVWLQSRSAYYCGRHQKTTVYDLYKRQLATDCDGLAGMYAYFAKVAGVKKVGCVWDYDHMWNWIKVNGKRYYIDYQDCLIGRSDANESVKELVDYCTKGDGVIWYNLSDLNKWYRENINPNAKEATNCKAIWDKLTAKQKKAYHASEEDRTANSDYQLKCSSYAQSNFRPLKAFCETNGFTVDESEDWKYSK